MKKSFLVCLMFISLIIGLVPVQLEKVVATSNEKLNFDKTQSNGESWEECDNCSKENPHLISTPQDLDKIRTHTHTENDVTTITGYFKLTNDIVFKDEDFEEGGAFYNEGHTWIAIGQSQVLGIDGLGLIFSGELNGNGHSIKNLKICPNSDDKKLRYYSALFARLGNDGMITNIVFDGIKNTTKHAPSIVVGTITGDNAELSNIVIKNCVVAGGSHMPATFLGHELKGSAINVIIENSVCGGDSLNANGGMIARAINNAKIHNLTINNCEYKYYALSGLLCGTMVGDNTIENLKIVETEYALAHPYAGAMVLTGDNANLFMKDVNIDFVYNAGLHGGLEEYDSYSVNSIPQNLKVTFDNVGFRYNLSGRQPTFARWWDAINEMARSKGKANLSCTDAEGNEAEVISFENAYYIVKNTPTDIIKSNDFLVGHLNGGEIPKDAIVVKGGLVIPVKKGSIFEGWYDNEALTGDAITSPVTGQTYYAKWKVCHHDNNNYAYTAEDSTLTQMCGDCGHVFGTATLLAPESLTYDGLTKTASITTSQDWIGDVPVIAYYSHNKKLSNAPIDAGVYTAQIAMDDVTASVDFTIEKAHLNIVYKTDEVKKHINEKEFINPLTTTVEQSVIYTSENPDVATVDENGKVTIKGAGTTVITATANETNNYHSSFAEYRLIVTDHQYEETWKMDKEGHWKECSICGEKKTREDHVYEEKECKICQYRKENINIDNEEKETVKTSDQNDMMKWITVLTVSGIILLINRKQRYSRK
ncbi:MAG: Ig-like domain-containing protein [Erysipelotrichales bacterium]|nr:Ig-like domain-containing protein [Erysipelotrichales bacterium]